MTAFGLCGYEVVLGVSGLVSLFSSGVLYVIQSLPY